MRELVSTTERLRYFVRFGLEFQVISTMSEHHDCKNTLHMLCFFFFRNQTTKMFMLLLHTIGSVNHQANALGTLGA